MGQDQSIERLHGSSRAKIPCLLARRSPCSQGLRSFHSSLSSAPESGLNPLSQVSFNCYFSPAKQQSKISKYQVLCERLSCPDSLIQNLGAGWTSFGTQAKWYHFVQHVARQCHCMVSDGDISQFPIIVLSGPFLRNTKWTGLNHGGGGCICLFVCLFIIDCNSQGGFTEWITHLS